jgi:hypothetical protein
MRLLYWGSALINWLCQEGAQHIGDRKNLLLPRQYSIALKGSGNF